MIIRWDNPEQTYLRVEFMGTVYQFPASNDHPDWAGIKAMVDAGTLVISPYAPPEETN